MSSIISEQIYRDVAANIISGQIKPGSKLEEQSIADQFKVSRTPVREAFRQLSAAGLIESKPRRGVRVIDFNVDQLADMYEAVADLEAICAGLCAERMTTLERKKLEAIHESARPLAKAKKIPDYAELNEQFHGAIRRGAHNNTLEESVKKIRKRLAPFRHPWLIKKRDRLAISYAEHEELVAAILAGDRERAHEAALQHVTNTSLLTMEILAASGND
ncbi:MAG: GntR family transcriptional regulator [Woeseia sp.]|jgi:DNA-binding GntR family transcriptional regulator|nr:GntR family transcriptional regulator [Woeseia sp.]MBT6209063.1 GntR family transcriptional regulator [Woeseia sp.]